MMKKVSIGIILIAIPLLTGCSTTENPLEGKWQGTMEVSGKLSLEQLAEFSSDTSGAESAPKTEVAVLTLEFTKPGQLKLTTEPMPSKSPFAPSEKTVSYRVVEDLPGQVQLELEIEARKRVLQLRYSSRESMTVTEQGGAPQLLPVTMTRLDEA